jgi:hypothetical protein
VLRLNNTDSMPVEIYQALVECSAFANWRRVEAGDSVMLVLAFHKTA